MKLSGKMKSVLISILVIVNFGIVNFAFAEEKSRLTYIGHATVLIESGEVNILTDPFWGDHIFGGLKRQIPAGMKITELPRIDLILISHAHPDHYDVEAIKEIGKGKGRGKENREHQIINHRPIVILPWGRGKQLRKLGFPVVELRPWQSYKVENSRDHSLQITAIPARHMWGHCLGYVVEIDGVKIYFTGDTKMFSGIERLNGQKIDLMLLPYDGYPVLGSVWTMEQAVKAVAMIQPKVCIPIHWGTFKTWYSFTTPPPPQTFAQMVEQTSPSVRCLVLKTGEMISFLPEDLVKKTHR